MIRDNQKRKEFAELAKSVKKALRYIKYDAPEQDINELRRLFNDACNQRERELKGMPKYALNQGSNK